MDKVVKRKVLVYCVHEGRLLVFRHVDYSWEQVGVQVPAGSVRADETLEDAALRELREETGYDLFKIDEFLGTTFYDISPYRPEIQERYFFRASLTGPLPDRWSSQEDHDGKQEPTRFECFWIPIEGAHVLQTGQSALLWRLVK